ILQGQICLIVCSGWQILYYGYCSNQLVAVLPSDGDSLGYRQHGLVGRMASHPFARILAFVDAKFERTATGNTTERAGGTLAVALNLQPTQKTVLTAVGVHGIQ